MLMNACTIFPHVVSGTGVKVHAGRDGSHVFVLEIHSYPGPHTVNVTESDAVAEAPSVHVTVSVFVPTGGANATSVSRPEKELPEIGVSEPELSLYLHVFTPLLEYV